MLSAHENKTPRVSVIERKPVNGQTKPRNNATREEEPKAPVSNSRWVALKRCLFILLPVPITIAVVTIHFNDVFYMSAEDGFISEVQNALQLASSAYGTLIATSVSAIAPHRIRYELAEGDGVALGYLPSGYQLSHLKTILSKEFWNGAFARSRGQTHLRHLSLVGLIGMSIVLVYFATPMAAILIVPKPSWWSAPLKQTNNTFIDDFVANSSELWPVHLTQSFIPDLSCFNSSALLNETCPAGGYSSIAETVPNWQAEYYNYWNVTFFNDNVARDLVSYKATKDSSLTSSPEHVLVWSLENYFQWGHNWKLKLTSANGRGLFMPLVQVQCAPSFSLNTTLEFPYSSLLYPPLSQVSNSTHWTLNAAEVSNNLSSRAVMSIKKPPYQNLFSSLGSICPDSTLALH